MKIRLSHSLMWIMTGAILLGLVSCTSDPDPDPVPELEPRLSTATPVITRIAGDLRGLLEESGLDLPVEAIQYDAVMYKVEYATTYLGQSVTASGTAFVPTRLGGEALGGSFAVLSFQHGTIAADDEAPSRLEIGDIQNLLYSAIAATGLIVVVPDYIGFGSSLDITHPYYVEEPTAQAVADIIRAGGELAMQDGRGLSQRLYLAGYSQGGYATFATHKYLEEQGIEWFQLQKSYPAAGGYDVPGVKDYFLDLETYDQPFFMAFVAEAYRTYYGWDVSRLSDFFNEPYASLIPDLFDGSLSGVEINALLNDTLSVLVAPGYLASPEDTEYAYIETAFAENALLDWTPSIQVAFYHGDADITVPYQNSVDVYQYFVDAGVPAEVISLTTLPGATHYTGFVPYLELMLNDLVDLESQYNE